MSKFNISNKILEIARKLFSSNKQIICFKDLYHPNTNQVCDCIDKCKLPPPSFGMEYIKFNLDNITKYKNNFRKSINI